MFDSAGRDRDHADQTVQEVPEDAVFFGRPDHGHVLPSRICGALPVSPSSLPVELSTYLVLLLFEAIREDTRTSDSDR